MVDLKRKQSNFSFIQGKAKKKKRKKYTIPLIEPKNIH